MTERREMGALEGEVMACLWERPRGATPGEVLDAMGSDLAYTTVMTILTRLWKKGLVEREHRGRAYSYRATVTEQVLAARRMGAALDGVRNRPAALAGFVESLSSKDAATLRRLLSPKATKR